jgi:hypothetical protein
VIRAFAGLLHKRLEIETDVRTLAALIDVLPSYGQRAVLWSDACMRACLAGRQDLAERVATEFLKPILDNIPVECGLSSERFDKHRASLIPSKLNDLP